MLNLQFWNSSQTFNGFIIDTYYLAENKTWLFAAADIYNVIEKLDKKHGTTHDETDDTSKPAFCGHQRPLVRRPTAGMRYASGRSVDSFISMFFSEINCPVSLFFDKI